jgi:transcription elongation GreA/GreB family factor
MEQTMNKKLEIVEQIIAHIDGKLLDIDKSINERLEAAREAETRNQSRYDTKGWEAAREAEGAAKIRTTLEQQKRFFLQVLQRVRTQHVPTRIFNVAPGSLVELKDQLGQSRWIFLVTCFGGIEIQDVDVVSVATPIARQILKSQIGKEVLLGNEAYVVSQIL